MPKFQIQTKKTQFINAAHTELNNLGTLLELYPEKIFPIVDTVYSAQSYTSPMNSLLKSIPHSTEKVKGMTFSWKMRGRHDKPLVIVDVAPQVNVDKPGSYQSDVAIIVDENFWLPGDVIKPGPANGDIKLRIQEGPTRSGNGYKYICRSFKKDFFLQKKYLEVGTEWVKLFSQYEEGAEQSGSTYFGSDISFTTSLSKYRKGYRITDYADRVP